MDPLLENMLAERPVRRQLDNGLTVLFYESRQAELVSVQAWVKTGSIHEGALLGTGLSHYLEHMAFKGTKQRNFQDITRQLQALGGQINAYTTFDRTVYYVDGPAEACGEALAILDDMLFESLIDPEECAREQGVILREIDMGEDDPDRRLMQRVFSTAYREHPYGLPVIGKRELFTGLGPDELQSYYRERYAPNNMVLVVVGAISEEAALPLIEQSFGARPMRQLRQAWYPNEPGQLGERRHVEGGPYQVSRGSMAWKIPGLTHADSPALDLVARILGHGISARLWQALREEQQLTHYIDASSWNPGQSGLFWISWVSDHGQDEAIEAAVLAELSKLQQTGITTEELEKARRQSLVSEVNGRKSMSGMGSRFGSCEVVAGDLGYPTHYFRQLDALVPDDLLTVAERYFQSQNLTTVSLRGEESGSGTTSKRVSQALPPFEETKLPNGAKLLLQPSSALPKLHLRVALLGGPCLEPAEAVGASALLATLLCRDTRKRSALEVAQRIEAVGGNLQEFAGNNSFGFSIELLSSDWQVGVELLLDALCELEIRPETFEREREAQLAQIREHLDEPLHVARRDLRTRYFGKHPFRYDSFGELDSLESLKLEQVNALATNLLRGPNLVVSLSGDFEPGPLSEALSEGLAGLPSAGLEQERIGFDKPAELGSVETFGPFEQAILLSAYPDVGIKHEEFVCGEVLDECLSGMSSQLFEKVRERQGLAYYVGSSRIVGIDTGLFYLYAGTAAESVERVREAYGQEIERIQTGGFLEGELERCRTHLKASKRMGMQTAGMRAMQAALNALYGLPINHYLDYDERLDAVTPERLQAFAGRLQSEVNLQLSLLPEAKE